MRYYYQVFVSQEFIKQREKGLHMYMEVVLVKLSHSQREECDKILILDELSNALSHMANENAQGLDDFPYEFYKSYLDFVCMDLYKVYLEALKCGTLALVINMSNIKFIHKKGYL